MFCFIPVHVRIVYTQTSANERQRCFQTLLYDGVKATRFPVKGTCRFIYALNELPN